MLHAQVVNLGTSPIVYSVQIAGVSSASQTVATGAISDLFIPVTNGTYTVQLTYMDVQDERATVGVFRSVSINCVPTPVEPSPTAVFVPLVEVATLVPVVEEPTVEVPVVEEPEPAPVPVVPPAAPPGIVFVPTTVTALPDPTPTELPFLGIVTPTATPLPLLGIDTPTSTPAPPTPTATPAQPTPTEAPTSTPVPQVIVVQPVVETLSNAVPITSGIRTALAECDGTTDFVFDGEAVVPISQNGSVDFALPTDTQVGDHTFAQQCDGQPISTVNVAIVRPSEGDTGANDNVNLTLGLGLLAGGVFGLDRNTLPGRRRED